MKNILDLRLSILLYACLCLGGTSQTILFFKFPVYWISIIVIVSILFSKNRRPLSELLAFLPIFIFSFLLLNLIYLIPLPHQVWTKLPGREVVVNGYNALGIDFPFSPMSLSPENTLISILSFLPPIALLLVVRLSRGVEELKLAVVSIVVIGPLSVVVGMFQIASLGKSFYLYNISHFDVAVGFFANSNHQAVFLAMYLPFSIFATFNGSDICIGKLKPSAKKLCTVFYTFIILSGILMTGSISGYVLAILAFVGTAIIMLKTNFLKLRIFWFFLSLPCLILFLDFMLFGSLSGELLSEMSRRHATSRPIIFTTTWLATGDYGIFGSGPGSFKEIYNLYENRDTITNIYVNSAHNEMIQIYLELGFISIILMMAFIWYYVKLINKCVKISSPNTSVALLCALSVLLVLVHSLVDYPLRTISVSTFVIFLLAVGLDQNNIYSKLKLMCP